MEYQDNGIFIVGCPRSGTTLLRIILNSHSKVCSGEETGILSYMDDLFKTRWKQLQNYNITEEEFLEEVKKFFLAIHHRYCDITKKSIWVDKTPSHGKHLDFISRLFPRCKIIHIIRDGRDVAASHKDKWGKKGFYSALYEWISYVRGIRKFRTKLPGQYFEIKYENLVKNPEKTLKNLLDFLELEWEDRILKYFSFSHSILLEDEVDKNPLKPLQKDRIGSWRKRLSLNEKILVSLGFRNLLIELGYVRGKQNLFWKKMEKNIALIGYLMSRLLCLKERLKK